MGNPSANNKKGIRSLLEVKGRKTLFWDKCWTLYMLLYTIVMFSFAISGIAIILNFKGSTDFQLGQEILMNWNRNYITSITSVPSSSNCPAGYEHWHDAGWPGIQQGCSCIDNDGGFNKLVTPGECSQLQLNSKCTTVASMKGVPFYTWRDPVKVCIKRSDYSLLSTPANCGPGYERCGSDNVRLCIPEGTQCPITDVVISGEYQINGYEKLELSATRNLFYSRNDSNFPISKFKASEYAFCAFDAEDDITLGKLDYILSYKHRTTCAINEIRYVILDIMGERELYVENNLLTTVKAIPGYPRPNDDYVWNLGFVRYFAWADSCRNGPYSISHVQDKLSINAARNMGWIVLALTIFSVGFSGLILPIRRLRNRIQEETINKYLEGKVEQKAKKVTYKKIFSSPEFLVDKTFKVLLFPILCLGIFFLRRDFQWFLTVQDNSCADESTYDLFKRFSDNLKNVYLIYIGELIIWIFIIIVDVLIAIIIIIRSPSPKKVHVRVMHHHDGREEEFLNEESEQAEPSRIMTPQSYSDNQRVDLEVKYRRASNDSHLGNDMA